MSLCDLPTNNNDQSTYLSNILKTLQQHIDINDGKLVNIHYKCNLIKKFSGHTWKFLLK